MQLLVKTTAQANDAGRELQRVASEVNPDVPVGKAVGLTETVGDSIADFRSTIWAFLVFAAAALVLTSIGLYGLISYSASQRTYEISVRMAIGAKANSIVGLILNQSLCIAVMGVAAGIAASLVLTRFSAGMLFGVTPADPLIFVGVSGLVLAVPILASAIPACRAARIDPIRTLRAE